MRAALTNVEPRRWLTAAPVVVAALALSGCGSGQTALQPQPETAPKPPIAAPSPPPDPTVRLSPHRAPVASGVADLVEKVAATVVNITTVQQVANAGPMISPFEFFIPPGMRSQPRFRQRTGAGTGFIIDPGGYVITNEHVVRDADELKVTLMDDRSYAAEVIGRDRKLDLALLRLKASDMTLPSVTLGTSETLRVGEQVLAVGNPFGLGHTVTLGIVSAKARTIGAGPYDDFIQTDASINPGNSGGPLFNMRGEVVGINTAIRAHADGIGFAIPVDSLRDILAQLKSKGYVERGKLGLAFQPVTQELAKALGLQRPHGALVSEVMPDSSAAKAGIRNGDVIVGVNDTAIHRAEELPRNVARHPPGASIRIALLRNRQRLTVEAKLDKLEDDEPPPQPPRPKAAPSTRSTMLGIEIEDHPDGGVRVVGPAPPGKNLQVGDIIVEVNGKPVADVEALRGVLKTMKRKSTMVLLRILRRGSHRFVAIPLKQP